jgi:hypothetical protein
MIPVHRNIISQDWRSSVAQSVWARMLAGCADGILPDEVQVPDSNLDSTEP